MKRSKQISGRIKMKVVQEYLSTTNPNRSLMQEYNIRGHSAIPKWMRKFGSLNQRNNRLNYS
jgi:hypothetical protein